MEDDWDDILTEVGGQDQYAPSRNNNRYLREETKRKTSTDDVDDLLRELELDGSCGKTSNWDSGTKHSGRFAKNKDIPERDSDSEECAKGPTVLGGESAMVAKQASTLRKVASSSLFCVHCDFAVNRWVGKTWSSEADYMFFRNTAPDRDKMKAMLVDKSGYAAYACQCCWVSTNKIQAIRLGDKVDGREVGWVNK
mmetsp:Transcript_28785/g.46575  ORF Transcript_28785/g.46575 Transcript_28785/m.46575 type:complete len:196 (-) Transcript_28785:8-595(-)